MREVCLKKINYYVFLFFVGSIVGWFLEILFSLIVRGKLVNPGSLSGPWCQIYGIAILIILLIVNKKDNFKVAFLKISLIVSIDEYLSAFISEEVFNHQLWDYSSNFLNFQGRICLSMTILFIIGGLIIYYLAVPLLSKIYAKYSKYIRIINPILTCLFILNIIIDIVA